MGKALALGSIAVFLALGPALPALAQDELLAQSFGLMIGDSENTSLGVGLARDLTHEEGLRIIPMIGAGSVEALHDLGVVKGVDAAIVSSDAMAYDRAHGLIRDAKAYRYVARLKPLDLILIARADARDVGALNGLRIATGPAGSAAYASGEEVLAAKGITFQRVPLAGQDALRALAEGRADAALVLGRDTDFSVLQAGSRSKGAFHILPLPYSDTLASTHVPALINARDVPGLLPEGADVETVAAGLIIAVREPARGSAAFSRLERFVRALYASPEMARSASHNNPTAGVAGWNLSAAVASALAKKHSDLTGVTASTQPEGDAP